MLKLKIICERKK